MPIVKVCIPHNLKFSDLRLARDSDGMVSFDWVTLEAICDASGIDAAVFRDSPEDNVAALITAWYRQHLADGGAPDAVQEDLIAEARAEDAMGGGLSYPPGSA
jgi:hypothetical protein